MKDSAIFSNKDLRQELYVDYIETPVGSLCLIASEFGLKAIKVIHELKPEKLQNEHTNLAKEQLKLYFEGKLKEFQLDFDLEGYTVFSKMVWEELLRIPYGKTITYMKLAINLGNPKCIRAAASANGRNPLPIIIPCHRVIGSDGSLTGYALGLHFKKELLDLENSQKMHATQGELEF